MLKLSWKLLEHKALALSKAQDCHMQRSILKNATGGRFNIESIRYITSLLIFDVLFLENPNPEGICFFKEIFALVVYSFPINNIELCSFFFWLGTIFKCSRTPTVVIT